jgi:putative flippase GtrA
MAGGVFSRYLVAGLWNTAFGYGIFAWLIAWRADTVHYLSIAVVSNVLAISNAYAVHKFFVFQSRGNYLREYLRYWLVYGGVAVVGIVALAILVSGLRVNVYVAQAGVVCLQVVLSFMGHQRVSFRSHGAP